MKTDIQKPYVISINKEGEWFYNDRKIIHPTVLRIFNDGLSRAGDGRYYLEVDGDVAEVVVEDAPFVVKRVMPAIDEGKLCGFVISLSDDTEDILNLDTLKINDKNVPYCLVKGGLLAKFSSKAYYMLSEYIEHDEHQDSYYIKIKSKKNQIHYDGDRT